MMSEDLQIYCTNCISWFTNDEVDWTYTDKEEQVCPHCKSEGTLEHAHETSEPTPWMDMKARIIRMEIANLESRIKDLNDILENELGQE